MDKNKIQKVSDPIIRLADVHSMGVIGDPGCEGLGTYNMKVYAGALEETGRDGITLVVGDLIFDGAFVSHVMGRTSSILSFDAIPLLIGQVIIAALGEEIAFRGFFVGKAMKIVPFWLCAVISSVVFAAGHIAVGTINLVAFDIAGIFIDSMIYAMIYRKSGNCLVCTISHILCNGTGIAAALLFF